jgi:pyruvate formate lyase activating enzyme
MKIVAVQKTSLIDYPDNISSILFLSGCNFRCPYCHNKDLVLDRLPKLDEEEVIADLKSRKKYIDGVVITGGEPTLYSDLIDLIRKIKEIPLLVKLDTNGGNPDLLEELLSLKLLDYVSMDIKADLENYSKAIGVEIDTDIIKESIYTLKNSKIDYEFRTTVVPPFFNYEIARNIGELIKGSKKYYLQQYVPKNTLDPKFENIKPYPREVLERFAEILKPYVKTTIR